MIVPDSAEFRIAAMLDAAQAGDGTDGILRRPNLVVRSDHDACIHPYILAEGPILTRGDKSGAILTHITGLGPRGAACLIHMLRRAPKIAITIPSGGNASTRAT